MDFEVVILGSDANAYYMARNCYEAYHKKAHIIGKIPMHFTSNSKILDICYYEDLHNWETLKKILDDFYQANKDKKILLIPSNDDYVRLIMEHQDYLRKYYYFHTISIDLLNSLLIKDIFYSSYPSLDTPETYVYDVSEKLDMKRVNELHYPLILKPGNGILYHEHEFSTQAKVYKIKNKQELLNTIKLIKESGYLGKLIIQKFIQGDDSYLFDCVVYCDQKGKVKLMTFAQIGLQEHTHTGIGNCTLLVNGYNEFGNTEETTKKLKEFIESINYHGTAEFDLKYDMEDKKFKVLEINPRQARSSYYLTALGYNLVEYLVNDLIYNKPLDYHFLDEKIALSFVPKYVIRKHVKNDKLKKEVFKLIKEKKLVNPLEAKYDKSFKRRIWLFVRKINYIIKYRKCEW